MTPARLVTGPLSIPVPLPPTRAVRRSAVLALALIVAMAVPAAAWDSPGGQTPVPEHRCAWLETRTPDPKTVWLWKFSTDGDTVTDPVAVLEKAAETTIAQDVGLHVHRGVREARLQGGADLLLELAAIGSLRGQRPQARVHPP